MAVLWSKKAKKDLFRVEKYSQQFGENTVQKLMAFLFKSIESLELWPNLGKSGRLSGTRELSLSKYPFIIVYRYQQQFIEILGIFHASQNIKGDDD